MSSQLTPHPINADSVLFSPMPNACQSVPSVLSHRISSALSNALPRAQTLSDLCCCFHRRCSSPGARSRLIVNHTPNTNKQDVVYTGELSLHAESKNTSTNGFLKGQQQQHIASNRQFFSWIQHTLVSTVVSLLARSSFLSLPYLGLWDVGDRLR